MYDSITFSSPVGEFIAISSQNNLVGLHISGQRFINRFSYQEVSSKENLSQKFPVLEQTLHWVSHYFLGKTPSPLELPLMPLGTPFQKEVWNELLKIPYGEVTTYGEIARTIAKKRGIPKMSPQAVGNAVGRNPIAIIIPCHRVIGASHRIGGYGGGIANKKFLLNLEGVKGIDSWH